MSQRCGQCNEIAYRLRFMPTIKKFLGYGPGSCGCAERHLGQTMALPKDCRNPFEIRFDHVNDELGNNLQVHNIRELERAEKRLGFQSVVLNSDAQNFNDPPQQKRIDMASAHNWRYSNEARFRDLQRR